MEEYTYDNVIINPTQEDVESLIGKEVYFYDNPYLCLKAANEKLASNSGILVEVYKDSINPFCVKGKSGSYKYPCIIEKKEEPKPKYVPFESKEEFIEAFHYHDNANYSETEDILMNYGMWLWSEVDGSYKLVTEIWNAGVVIGDDKMRITNEEGHIDVFNDTTSWVKLFSEYRFLDGSPCGKEVEDE